MQCARRISGITFIRYAQNRKIGKPNNLKVVGSKKTKANKQDSQFGYDHLCLRDFLYYQLTNILSLLK